MLRRSIISLLLTLCTAAHAVAVEPPHALSEFFGNHCLSCHDSDTAAGGLSLADKIGTAISNDAAAWETVLRRLHTRQMPPIGEPRPDEATYNTAITLLERQLENAAAANPNPGRTDTFRRLTRTEYVYAIRDLLHLEIDAAALLPKDEVSHGFDNITVGDLSPTLLNRYISAARKISQLAVGASGASGGGDTFRLRPDITQEERVEGLPIGTRGGTLIRYNFPVDGEYEVSVRLMRDRNEHVEGLTSDHELDILLDRKRIALLKVKRPQKASDHQIADNHLNATFHAKAGPHDLGVTFLKNPSSLIETKRQPFEAHFNFHRHPRQSPAIYEVTIARPSQSGIATKTPSRQQIFCCMPKSREDETACANRILSTLIRQAYRRPATADDLKTPMQFFHDAAADRGFEAGIEEALSSILVNPKFLFRIERDPPDVKSGEPYFVDDFELASRLSFVLWSSLPDEELLAAAENGTLSEPEVLASQVTRMLADKRSNSLVTSFASQWLYLRNLETLTPDLRLFPDFDHNLREAFRKETELFFQTVLREDRSVLDLINADYTFLNERLAKHYGVPHVYGSRFRRVNLPRDSERGGLLRHGSILTVTSYATRTSPVIRGHWILQNLLGSPPPPPPNDVPALEDNTVDSNLSVRERLAVHRANPACASCHNIMDPVGFSLENFDAIGRWRDSEAGKPVDASGGLPDWSRFSGVAGLEQGILDRPELFVGTLTRKLLTYALGRGVENYDEPAIREIVRAAKAEDYRFSSLIQGVVASKPFRMRKAE